MNASDSNSASKAAPCYCTAVLGILVIVFAWWTPGWAPIALTIIGAVIAARGFLNQCCCAGATCKTTPNETPAPPAV